MNPFLRYLSFLMALLVLGGCGQSRSSAISGKPYSVTLGEGVLVAQENHLSSVQDGSAGSHSSGSWNLGGSFSGGGGGGSGGDFVAALVVIVAVVIVASVVICVVDCATPDHVVERYYVTLSGDVVPLEIVTITTTNHMYLDDRQYDALVRGAYTRAVIRPAVWEGSHGSPTQEVQVNASRGMITISLVTKTTENAGQIPQNN